ncbi:MAG TPA: MFS transporter [Clostridia bacterium]
MKSIQKSIAMPTILAVATGTFMASLDTSVVNIAMPVIQNHFHVTLSMVEWVVTAYLLVVSSMLLTFGRLSDIYGHKKVYVTGFVIFTISSLLCGLSINIIMLISCRILQALGAGMMFSTGPAIITNAVPPENRGKALSFSAIAVAVALCTGPVLGGILITITGWQSIFFINIPVGILGTILALKNIPEDSNKVHAPFDIVGSVLIFTALILILLPLDISDKSDLSPFIFYGMLAAGILLVVVFIIFEKNSEHPILNISLFKNRAFTASNIAALLNFMAQFIMAFLAPFYLQKLRMLPPASAGLLFIPMPLTTLVTAPVSGIISDRFDSRYISSAGMGIMSLGLFMLSFLAPDTPYYYIIISMIVTGLGSGMFQTPNNSTVMGSVSPQNRGAASGTLATMRNIGMVIGVAISGAVFSTSSIHADLIFSAKGLSGLSLFNSSFTYALHITFIVAGFVALAAFTASLVKGAVKL